MSTKEIRLRRAVARELVRNCGKAILNAQEACAWITDARAESREFNAAVRAAECGHPGRSNSRDNQAPIRSANISAPRMGALRP